MPIKRLPARTRLPDFAGRLTTLANGPECWQILKEGSDLLLLGLGPGDLDELPFIKAAHATGQKIFWLEAPEIKSIASFRQPKNSSEINREQARALLPGCKVAFYRPGLRLAPNFWGPLLARTALAGTTPARRRPGLAWLPGNSSQLLHLELRTTLQNCGYECCEECSGDPAQFLEIWRGGPPGFAISVNFRGLDSEGRIFELLREAGIPLAIWLVDNPWNLLSGIPLPWWQEASLFLSDASFIPGLKKCGAKSAAYLPLAASSHMFHARRSAPLQPPLFVGRSAFPGQKQFFAASRVSEDLLGEASRLLQTGQPDFHWWQNRLQLPLWPGNKIRQASLGADLLSSRRRADWIASAAKFGLRLIGDEGWRKLLPAVPLLAPVDYYGSLPDLYANAAWTLNVTSLLLPESLNQRHFDVWAAGGFLFTDNSPALELFPNDLVEPIAATSASGLALKVEQLASNPENRNILGTAWRELIRTRHTYGHRLATIAEALGLSLDGAAA